MTYRCHKSSLGATLLVVPLPHEGKWGVPIIKNLKERKLEKIYACGTCGCTKRIISSKSI